MLIDGVSSGSTVTCAANDQVIVRSVSTTQFKLSRVKYDGTAQVSAGLSAASQAQAEAGTADTVALTPLSANWHPGVAKAWVVVGIVGDIAASYNVASVTDVGTGQTTTNIATDFSSANYTAVVTAEYGNQAVITIDTAPTAGTVNARVRTPAGADIDPVKTHVVCFGDQ